MKVKQLRDEVAQLEVLCTPQYTHLPCVIKLLRSKQTSAFNLATLDPLDVQQNITMFCNVSRRLAQLEIKINQLEDVFDA